MPWRCFWTEETGDVHLRLRRYVSTSEDGSRPACPGGYHNAASEIVGRRPQTRREDRIVDVVPVEEFEGNPSWPTTCQNPGCDYEFTDDDPRQVWADRIYRRADTGEEYDSRALPPGAMLDGHWYPDQWKGADGIALVVVLPPGGGDTRGNWWNADGPAASGGKWTRQGDPRQPETVTVSPSILTGEYHGFLQAGFLTDSLGDRPMAPGPD